MDANRHEKGTRSAASLERPIRRRIHSRLDSSFGFILQTFDFPVRFVQPLSFSSNSQLPEAFKSVRVQLLSVTVEGYNH
jgi:hypothetical protein